MLTDRHGACCRACRTGRLTEVLDFGMMPIANRLVDAAELDAPEFRFHLAVGVCTSCWMLQLQEILPPAELFTANYPYFSSTSKGMQAHFQGFAADVQRLLAKVSDPFIVEIGSNDGIMLRHFRPARVLGVEPSASVAAAAAAHDVPSMVEFFSMDVAERIVATHGHAHAILGANVVRHNADLHELFAAARVLLDDRGVLVFEDPALTSILDATAWDQIYDEHVYYYSLTSIARVLDEHGFRVFDIGYEPVHGGTFRIHASPAELRREVSPRVEVALEQEAAAGLTGLDAFLAFAARARASREKLTALARGLREGGKRLAGYGATAKGTIVLNSCGLGADVVEYITDSTPAKQGRFLPGLHIPIVPPQVFRARPPDYALLLAWNHAAEIMNKEKAFLDAGGRFICHVPDVSVV